MKTKLLAAFLLMTVAASAQYTLIPDVNFENKLINMNLDSGAPDGKVATSNIQSLTSLDVHQSNISSLAGIEGFVSLTSLICDTNHLTTLDVTKNTALTSLDCSHNQLTGLNLSMNTAITELDIDNNQFSALDLSKNTALTYIDVALTSLTALDFSKNTALTYIDCSGSQLRSLDVSKNAALTYLNCSSNKMTSLNVKNGANTNLTTKDFRYNPNLTCIQVDDKAYSDAHWPAYKDATASFSTDCAALDLGINEMVFGKMSIYPNPTKGELHIDNVNLENATVYDASGKTLQTKSFDTASDKNTMTVNGLSKGVYYIFIEAQGAQATAKVVIE